MNCMESSYGRPWLIVGSVFVSTYNEGEVLGVCELNNDGEKFSFSTLIDVLEKIS